MSGPVMALVGVMPEMGTGGSILVFLDMRIFQNDFLSALRRFGGVLVIVALVALLP